MCNWLVFEIRKLTQEASVEWEVLKSQAMLTLLFRFAYFHARLSQRNSSMPIND